MNLVEKLIKIQTELKAPKNQYNKFGQYYYRSAEDIKEALKPFSKKHKVLFKESEVLKEICNEPYVEVTVKIIDSDDPTLQLEAQGSAVIDFNAKGMQKPQQTGAASSYATKYAYQHLLLLDDTKDADSQDNSNHNSKITLKKGSEDWKKVTAFLEKGGNISKVLEKFEIPNNLISELKTK